MKLTSSRIFEISKIAIRKTKSASIAFFLFSPFLSPRSFFFSFPFLLLLVILEPFEAFSRNKLLGWERIWGEGVLKFFEGKEGWLKISEGRKGDANFF